MGKRNRKGPAESSRGRYELRSQNPPPAPDPAPLEGAGNQQHRGPYQPPPQWSAMNGNMGSNGFSNGTPFQAPQMFNGMNPFNMALAQPNLFSGLQSMQVPFYPPNVNMGFGTSHPGFPSDQRHPNVQRVPHVAPDSTHSFSPSTPPHNAIAPQPSSLKQSRKRDRPITAPSKASGGVPDPTPAYTMRASFMPKRRDHPGPLLVVIDLNGTVLYRPNSRQSHIFQSRRYAQPFVTYCVETFWVVIWSSARPDNVARMVDQLLTPDSLRQVVAVWGRDRFGLTDADYRARTQCYKRLTTLWDDPVVRGSYPRGREGFEGGCWNQGNTVLIDDSAEKARSEPHNAITLPEFTGEGDEAVDVLPMVHDYLNELCYQVDVSAYMRAHPFKMA